ncbi:MAG: RNA polymerase sigma factor [Pyrinomonadaceae bacterium]|nr:RNA polymerase sigma factor [Sphingobacteriaceae bacterium]
MEAEYVDQHYNLVVECKNGNRKAQFELYKLYSKAMYNVALRILGNEDEAADLLQEAFIDAFKRVCDFRQESSFGTWIKQIVVNKSISQLRKRKFELIAIEDVNPDELVAEESSNEQEIELKVNEIKRAIQVLPDGYRIVLSLYLLEGYDHEEIAHILKITENTSRTQFMRAKRKLIVLLKQKGLEN